jgi:hypothetical protein
MTLEDLRKLAKDKSPGEWTVHDNGAFPITVVWQKLHLACQARYAYDADFIAAFANHAEALLDVVEAAKKVTPENGVCPQHWDALDIAIEKLEEIK